MTLIKSSIPLTVYRAESPLLANITGDAIRRFAFRSIDNVPEEKACGFVNCDDMFDTEWINSIPEKVDISNLYALNYLCLCLSR